MFFTHVQLCNNNVDMQTAIADNRKWQFLLFTSTFVLVGEYTWYYLCKKPQSERADNDLLNDVNFIATNVWKEDEFFVAALRSFKMDRVNPRPVSLINPALKEPDGASTSKVDILKESQESAAHVSQSRSTTISQNCSVASSHLEPSNKQLQHDLPVKEEGHVKGYCYATPFSSYAYQLYPQKRPPNSAPAARRSLDNSKLHTSNKMCQSEESNLINEKTRRQPGRRWTEPRGFMNEKALAINRLRTSNKMCQNGESNFMNEKTRGPRGSGLLVSRTSTEKDKMSSITNVDQYNRSDFETDYDDAMFFVIKSFSEDDIHRCIKYKVWASTQSGNKKLDAAYHGARVRSSDTGRKCPIFLFFSVNGSGQFVGLAEMTGQVDFKKTMNFWQLDKWTGFFPVKWHIIKDISNQHLRHIILENNENKPVTHSRDTQEIKFEQGLEILTIFKSFMTKSSLLDDFSYYDKESNKKGARYLRVVSEAEVNIDSSKQDDYGSSTSHKVKKLTRAPKQSLLDLANKLSIDSHSAD